MGRGERGYLQTGSSSTEKLPTGLMGDWLTDGARNGGCTDTITITLPDEALPPVKASFSMTGRGTGSGGLISRSPFLWPTPGTRTTAA